VQQLLLQLVETGGVHQRLAAVRILGDLGGPSALPALRRTWQIQSKVDLATAPRQQKQLLCQLACALLQLDPDDHVAAATLVRLFHDEECARSAVGKAIHVWRPAVMTRAMLAISEGLRASLGQLSPSTFASAAAVLSEVDPAAVLARCERLLSSDAAGDRIAAARALAKVRLGNGWARAQCLLQTWAASTNEFETVLDLATALPVSIVQSAAEALFSDPSPIKRFHAIRVLPLVGEAEARRIAQAFLPTEPDPILSQLLKKLVEVTWTGA
jgi:HEAT repeat protein